MSKMRSAGVDPATDGAKNAPGLDLMSLVVNPDSFCETVENMFDLSFLVKDSKATIAIDDATGLPTCRPGQDKGDSTSLQRECSARTRSGKSIHASRPFREMIARPKISRNEWKPAERGAFEVGNFAL